MYDPVAGNRHDSFLLSHSGHLNKVEEFITYDTSDDIEDVICLLYDNPSFPWSTHIFEGYKNSADGSAQAHCNSQISMVMQGY